MTTTPAMPEHTIDKHDHPEPHTMRWSELELAAIKRYAESYALALRPQSVPMPYDLANEFAREMVKGGRSVEWLVRKVEAHHGITAPAGGEGDHG